jgi:hypothetical protein
MMIITIDIIKFDIKKDFPAKKTKKIKVLSTFIGA